jgi:hypothetical protein
MRTPLSTLYVNFHNFPVYRLLQSNLFIIQKATGVNLLLNFLFYRILTPINQLFLILIKKKPVPTLITKTTS